MATEAWERAERERKERAQQRRVGHLQQALQEQTKATAKLASVVSRQHGRIASLETEVERIKAMLRPKKDR